MGDFLRFVEDDEKRRAPSKKWKILIVDDEEDVHRVTRLILRDLRFDGRGVEVLSAYSKNEAMRIMRENPDIAVAIIDVVMEDKSAGLDLVKYIREELKNHRTRLIIRTGQPGYAPRKEVIMGYDINDYREKTELSAEMMIGVVITALRSYRDIISFEREKEINRILTDFVANPPKETDVTRLILRAMNDLSSLLKEWEIELSGAIRGREGGMVRFGENPPDDVNLTGKRGVDWLDDELRMEMVVMGKPVAAALLRFEGYVDERLKETLRIYAIHLMEIVENEELEKSFNDAMYKIIQMLADLIEHRSEETGEHVRRVGEMAKVLAERLGFDENKAKIMELAAMLHDVGKIGIPDNILNKPSRLTEEEFEIMKRHTVIGYEILSKYDNEIFKMAAVIAKYHHENWDGSGYPEGLKGEEIPLEARIVSVVDTYDALLSDRIYRPAWSERETLEYIKNMSGIKFDPKVVEVFLSSYDEIRKIRERL